MEKRKTGKLHVITRFLKGNLHMFVLVLVFSMLNTVFNSLTPQIVRISVDSVIGGEPYNLPGWLITALNLEALRGSGWQVLLLAGAAIMVTAIISGLCNYVSKMEMAKGSEGFVKGIRDQLYAHIQKLPFSWHVKHQTGEIIQRCTSDVEVIRNFVCNQMVEVFRLVFLIALYMGIMFSMNVKITLVASR